jgi:DNA-directed RNA polymerase specialized sigma24 family protein
VSPRWHAEYAEYVEARLPWLRRTAYLLCQDWHGADDLVQVTVARLFTHWPRAARMDNVDAYVRTILVRAFLDVSGRAAYWLKGGHGLAWQYAPAGWADLDWGSAGPSWPPRGAERTAILRAAASIRYRQATPLVFPYWLAGPPKGWRLSDVGFNEQATGPSGVTLTLTDAAPGLPLNSVEFTQAGTIQIQVVPTDSADGGCAPDTGAGNVTLDGARAELSADGKYLCAADVHGLTVAVILTVHGTIRDPAGPGGALGYARKLHLSAPARPPGPVIRCASRDPGGPVGRKPASGA